MALDVITLYCDSDNNVDRMMVVLESPMESQKKNIVSKSQQWIDLVRFHNVHP